LEPLVINVPGEHMLSRLLRTYLGRYRWALLAVVVLQTMQAVSALYLPSLNASIIDKGVARCRLFRITRLDGIRARRAQRHLSSRL
jgi:hypothetical protein